MQNDIVKQPAQSNVSQPPSAPALNTDVVVNNKEQLQAPNPTVQQQKPAKQPEQQVQPEPEIAAPKADKKPTKPVGIIMTAVFLCAGLTGTAIYAGILQTGEENKAGSAQLASQPSSDDTNELVQEVDAAINDTSSLQDPAQNISADLSDESLGL